MQQFIEIIVELNVGGMERYNALDTGFLNNHSKRVNTAVMNQTIQRKSLPDGHGGDGSVTAADCFAADDTVLEGRTLRVAVVGLER